MATRKTIACKTCRKSLKSEFKLCPCCGSHTKKICLNCGDALGEHARLARAGYGQDEDLVRVRSDGFVLLGVEFAQDFHFVL